MSRLHGDSPHKPFTRESLRASTVGAPTGRSPPRGRGVPRPLCARLRRAAQGRRCTEDGCEQCRAVRSAGFWRSRQDYGSPRDLPAPEQPGEVAAEPARTEQLPLSAAAGPEAGGGAGAVGAPRPRSENAQTRSGWSLTWPGAIVRCRRGPCGDTPLPPLPAHSRGRFVRMNFASRAKKKKGKQKEGERK